MHMRVPRFWLKHSKDTEAITVSLWLALCYLHVQWKMHALGITFLCGVGT